VHVSRNTFPGRRYFHNALTGEVTWTEPPELRGLPRRAPCGRFEDGALDRRLLGPLTSLALLAACLGAAWVDVSLQAAASAAAGADAPAGAAMATLARLAAMGLGLAARFAVAVMAALLSLWPESEFRVSGAEEKENFERKFLGAAFSVLVAVLLEVFGCCRSGGLVAFVAGVGSLNFAVDVRFRMLFTPLCIAAYVALRHVAPTSGPSLPLGLSLPAGAAPVSGWAASEAVTGAGSVLVAAAAMLSAEPDVGALALGALTVGVMGALAGRVANAPLAMALCAILATSHAISILEVSAFRTTFMTTKWRVWALTACALPGLALACGVRVTAARVLPCAVALEVLAQLLPQLRDEPDRFHGLRTPRRFLVEAIALRQAAIDDLARASLRRDEFRAEMAEMQAAAAEASRAAAAAAAASGGAGRCCICMDADADAACTPCGHVCGCSSCLGQVYECPVCREPLESVLRIYAAGTR